MKPSGYVSGYILSSRCGRRGGFLRAGMSLARDEASPSVGWYHFLARRRRPSCRVSQRAARLGRPRQRLLGIADDVRARCRQSGGTSSTRPTSVSAPACPGQGHRTASATDCEVPLAPR